MQKFKDIIDFLLLFFAFLVFVYIVYVLDKQAWSNSNFFLAGSIAVVAGGFVVFKFPMWREKVLIHSHRCRCWLVAIELIILVLGFPWEEFMTYKPHAFDIIFLIVAVVLVLIDIIYQGRLLSYGEMHSKVFFHPDDEKGQDRIQIELKKSVEAYLYILEFLNGNYDPRKDWKLYKVCDQARSQLSPKHSKILSEKFGIRWEDLTDRLVNGEYGGQ